MPSLAEICSKLKSEGWRVSEQSVLKGLEDEDKSLSTYQEVRSILLNVDLKDVVDNKITDDSITNSKKASTVSGPLVLQVCKVRNICNPKAAEGGEVSGGRLMRLTLTDGNSPYHAIEFTPCPAISPNIAPGSKVLLTGRIPQASGFMLLSPKMISILGGKVDALYEKWVLTESVLSFSSHQACVNSDGSRPPPWIPFSKAGVKGAVANGESALKGFKSLKDAAKEGEDGNSAAQDRFAEQRKQAVQELVKGKQGAKVFGGGKQMPDAAVTRVVGAGFSADVAQWALSNNAGDATAAIMELRAAAAGQPIPSVVRRDSSSASGGRDRGGGRGGRGGGRRGRGRGEGGPDDSDDDFEAMRDAPRPSGPASLFDFFDAKLAERNETVQFVEPVADVRGSVYDRSRQPETRDTGRGGRRARGRGVGSSFTRETARRRASTPPPDMTSAQEWPAPGEEHPAKTRGSDTTTTYIQSQSRLEEREEEQLELERMAREAKMRMAKERSGEVAPRSVGGSSNSYDRAGSSFRGTSGYRGSSGGSNYKGGSGVSYHDSSNNIRGRGYSGGARYNNNNNSTSNYRGGNSGYSDNRGGGRGSFGDGDNNTNIRENSSNTLSSQGRGNAGNYRDSSRGSSQNYNSSRDDSGRSTTTADTSDSSPQKGGKEERDKNSVSFDEGIGDGGYNMGRDYVGPRGGGYRGRYNNDRGSRGGYDGYSGGGYNNSYRGGSNDSTFEGGYNSSYRGGGYDNYRGGYDNYRGGGYDNYRGGGHDNYRGGGYGNNYRGYENSNRGKDHTDRRGGYGNGGYDANSVGHDSNRGAYSSRRGSSNDGGGYHGNRGQQQQRGYGAFTLRLG